MFNRRISSARKRRGWRRPPPVLAAAVAPWLTALVLATAAHPAEPELDETLHEHDELTVDPALTLSRLVDETLVNYPARADITARREQAEAWRRRGESWMSGQPVLAFRYQTDRYGQDAGLQEIEAGLQLALWKWGERQSTQSLGRALTAETDAAMLALRWEVAGLLRELLWEMARTAGEYGIAERSMAVADRLAATIERRYELGDVALSDALLARSQRLDAEATLADANVALVDAERAYRSLTRLDRRPPFDAEPLSASEGIDAGHPALAFVSAELERADAKRELAQQAGRSAPTLTIGPRRERAAAGIPYEESIGVYLTVPFGGRPHVATLVTEAGREAAAARVTLQQTLRELDLQKHEASHRLAVARSNLELATSRARLAQQGYAMGESAYSKGELGLIELLNLQGVYLDAERQALQFEIEEKRQTALYNQAIGVVP